MKIIATMNVTFGHLIIIMQNVNRCWKLLDACKTTDEYLSDKISYRTAPIK